MEFEIPQLILGDEKVVYIVMVNNGEKTLLSEQNVSDKITPNKSKIGSEINEKYINNGNR